MILQNKIWAENFRMVDIEIKAGSFLKFSALIFLPQFFFYLGSAISNGWVDIYLYIYERDCKRVSSDLTYKEGHARFTTIPSKPFVNQFRYALRTVWTLRSAHRKLQLIIQVEFDTFTH